MWERRQEFPIQLWIIHGPTRNKKRWNSQGGIFRAERIFPSSYKLSTITNQNSIELEQKKSDWNADFHRAKSSNSEEFSLVTALNASEPKEKFASREKFRQAEIRLKRPHTPEAIR